MGQEKVSHYNTKSTADSSKKTETLEPIVMFVKDSWESWDAHWGNKLQEFERYYSAWLGTPPKRDEDWQSQFHKRLSWQAEKTLVARYHSALFPTSAPIDTDSTEINDELQALVGKSMVAHWFKIGLISKEFLSGMRSAAIYGTGLFEDEWYQKVDTVPEEKDVQEPDYRPMVLPDGNRIFDEDGNVRTEEVGIKTVKKLQWNKKIIEDRYKVKKASIFSWRIHPNKLNDDDDFPVIKQEFVTYNDLKRKETEAKTMGYSAFNNMDLIEESIFGDNKDLKRLEKEGEYKDDKNPRIELLHYWGFYSDTKKDENNKSKTEEKKMWITIANRQYLIQKKENPRWDKKPPLFHIVWTEDEKPSYYGIGVVQIGKDAEDRANLNVNIRSDMKKKLLKGGGWYNALDKKIKKKELQTAVPGLYRACSDVNSAAKPDIPITLTPDDYKEEETAVNDHREITGATASLAPTGNRKDVPDTLGGMQMMLSQSVQKLKPDLVMMELMGVRQIANRAFILTRQFFKQNKAIELVASQDELKRLGVSKVYQYTPDMITQNLNFFCTGLSESIDKAQNIDKLTKLMELTSKIPPAQAITNYPNIIKRIALWLGLEDVEDFITMNPNMPMQPMQPPQPAGGPQGVPGQPQGMPQGGPQGMPPQMPPNMGGRMPPPGPGGNGGLPPQLQMILQQMMQRRMQQQQGMPQGMPNRPQPIIR